MTDFRYEDVNVVPDPSTGKYSGSGVYPSDYGFRVSNRRGFCDTFCPRDLYRFWSLYAMKPVPGQEQIGKRYQMTRLSNDHRILIATADFCQSLEDFRGATETWEIDGYVWRCVVDLTSKLPGVKVAITAFMPLERDGVIVKLVFSNSGASPVSFYLYHFLEPMLDGHIDDEHGDWDAVNECIVCSRKTGGVPVENAPFLVLVGNLTPAGHRSKLDEDYNAFKSYIDANKPFPVDFDRDSAGPGHVYASLAFNLTVPAGGETTLCLPIAFSGITATQAHAIEEANYLKDPTNAETEENNTLQDFADYIQSSPVLTIPVEPKILGAYRYAQVLLRANTFPDGLYVTGWNGYWLSDIMQACWGLLPLGKWGDVYDELMMFAALQQEDGGIPTHTNGAVDAEFTTPVFCHTAHQLILLSRNDTYKTGLKPYLEKAYGWIVDKFNDVDQLILTPEGFHVCEDALWSFLNDNTCKASCHQNVFCWKVLDEAIKIYGDTLSQYAEIVAVRDALKAAIDEKFWQEDRGFYGAIIDTNNNTVETYGHHLPGQHVLMAGRLGYPSHARMIAILTKMAEANMTEVPGQMFDVPLTYGPALPYEQHNVAEWTYQNGPSWPLSGAVLSWLLDLHDFKSADQSGAFDGSEITIRLSELMAIVHPICFCEWYHVRESSGSFGGPGGCRAMIMTTGPNLESVFRSLGIFVDVHSAMRLRPRESLLNGATLVGYKVGDTTFNVSYQGSLEKTDLDYRAPESYIDGETHEIAVDADKNEITIDGVKVVSDKIPYVCNLVSDYGLKLDSWSWNPQTLSGSGVVSGPAGKTGVLKIRIKPRWGEIKHYIYGINGVKRVADDFDPAMNTLSIPVTCSNPTGITLEFAPCSPFDARVKMRGVDVTIVKLTETGVDEYEKPVYSESYETVKAFVRTAGSERGVAAGFLKLGQARFLMSFSVDVEEDDEIAYVGVRWRIKTIDPKKSHIEVLAERKIE